MTPASIGVRVAQINRLAQKLESLQKKKDAMDRAVQKVEQQLGALFGNGSVRKARVTRKKRKAKKSGKLTADQKKRIGAAMKKSWAKRKKKKAAGKPGRKPGRPKTKAKKAIKKRKGMSAANRKKMSAMMKARWAAKRK